MSRTLVSFRGLVFAGRFRRRVSLNQQHTGQGRSMDGLLFCDYLVEDRARDWLRSSASGSFPSATFFAFGYSRPVTFASSIVALTTTMSAFHHSLYRYIYHERR
jgi:hypothetical protein